MNARANMGAGAKRTSGPMIDPAGGVAINRMPGLTTLMTQAAGAMAASLQPLLEVAPQALLEGITATTLEKSLAQSRNSLGATIACPELDERLLVAFEPQTAAVLTAAIFGETPPRDGSETLLARESTSIEKRIAHEFARAVAGVFEATFLANAASAFALEGLLSISDAKAMGWRDMPAAEAQFSVATTAGPCSFKLLVPQTVLQMLRETLSQETSSRPATRDPHWTQQMSAGVSKAPVAVSAVLEQFEMTLGDVAAFKVGHVLELRGGALGRVRLECAGQGVFWGRLSQSDAGYRIEVEGPIEDEDDLVAALLPN